MLLGISSRAFFAFARIPCNLSKRSAALMISLHHRLLLNRDGEATAP
jgi:hypothetical protein